MDPLPTEGHTVAALLVIVFCNRRKLRVYSRLNCGFLAWNWLGVYSRLKLGPKMTTDLAVVVIWLCWRWGLPWQRWD